MQLEDIRTVFRHRDIYVLKCSKGIGEPSMLRSGWCSCTVTHLCKLAPMTKF